MKKRIVIALVMVAMLLSLAGCARKTTVSITINNIGDFEISKVPAGFENLSTVDNTVKITVKKDGEYPITVKAEDGKEYTVVLKYEKGVAYVESEELDLIAGVERG